MSTVRAHAAIPGDRAFFGHPRGLSTLFFTEMWERFSYYGMRALLILFMTAPAAAGGLGFDTGVAGAVYGLYTSMVYMTSLPGGWIADRLIGQRRAVLYGGIVIACGHFSMAFPRVTTFYLGLTLIVVGTGLLKGNAAVIVGALYGPNDSRRDAGFSIYYMGINLGAFIAPLVCGYLGQRVNWHIGFGAAGIGMVCGLIQYTAGGRYLGDAGLHPAPAKSPEAASQLRSRAQSRNLRLGVPEQLFPVAAAPLHHHARARVCVGLDPARQARAVEPREVCARSAVRRFGFCDPGRGLVARRRRREGVAVVARRHVSAAHVG